MRCVLLSAALILLSLSYRHSRQDNAAVSVGKGRIGFPNALGQPAKGFLGLNTVILPILLDFGKVNHGFPPLRAL